MLHLPLPSPAARAHSAAVSEHIQQATDAAGGILPFARFMEMALYAPGLGYYHSGKTLFGAAGDFITAPELSPLFGYCIGEAITPVLQQHPAILEFGAGSGKLAASLLESCPLIANYFILEPSSALQQQQQHYLRQHAAQHYAKIHWLQELPTHFSGVIVANEVMDALPATVFRWQPDQIEEQYVQYTPNQWQSVWQPATAALYEKILALPLPAEGIYISEIQLWLAAWIASLAQLLQQGIILLFDYGFPRKELYHPDRNQGTLMCHYQHRAHSDPFFYPGLQDITVHVDFTAVAEAAVENNLTVAGYTSQAAFLLENKLLEKARDASAYAAVKRLTLPHEMGELFKVIALTRHWSLPLQGFQQQDRRHRL